jgi:hypothetical protein
MKLVIFSRGVISIFCERKYRAYSQKEWAFCFYTSKKHHEDLFVDVLRSQIANTFKKRS